MVVIGEKLGLYKALAEGPMTPAELASKTKTDERYLREWLSSQAAGGYISYDANTHKFSLSVEQAFALADREQPRVPARAFGLTLGSLSAVPELRRVFSQRGWNGLART